jgi:hypothetical protein
MTPITTSTTKIWSMWRNRCARVMRKPSPSCAASSSATTIRFQAAARFTRAVSITPGTAYGKTTLRKTVGASAPSVRATLISSPGTCQTTFAVISVLKKTVPMTIRATFGSSPNPSQIISSGTNAVAGM